MGAIHFIATLVLPLYILYPTQKAFMFCRAGRYEVDGYVYNAAEEPKILITGKWNEALNYQVCDPEGEPLPGSEMKEVSSFRLFANHINISCLMKVLLYTNTTVLYFFN